MSFFPLRFRTGLFAVIISLTTAMLSAHPLDAYRNKNRLVLISLPSAPSVQKFSTIFSELHKPIDERDIILIDISPRATQIPRTVRMTDEQTAQLRKQFLPDADANRAVFILIGKDGGEKSRQIDALDLSKWFALIDQMPMRRQEIKSQQQ